MPAHIPLAYRHTAAGILVMLRKMQPSVTDVELGILRSSLRAAESSRAAAAADLEDLRKQVVERDRTIQQNSEELNEKQRQFELAIAHAEEEAAQRSAAEERIRELSAEAVALRNQRAELEVGLEREKTRLVEQTLQQAASYDVQLEADRRQIQELNDAIAHFTAECAELNTQLKTELERSRQLTDQMAALHSERQSAAKEVELLLTAQQNLSRLLKPVWKDTPHGANGDGSRLPYVPTLPCTVGDPEGLGSTFPEGTREI